MLQDVTDWFKAGNSWRPIITTGEKETEITERFREAY